MGDTHGPTESNGYCMKHTKIRRAETFLDAAVKTLRVGDVAIDCGANVGKITRMLAETRAFVYAFEPDPVVFDALRGNLGSRPNVSLRAEAVGTQVATAKLLRSPYYAENPILEAEKNTICSDALTRRKEGGWQPMDTQNAVEVSVIDLPSLVRDLAAHHGRVAVLKLDIEGMEVPILESLETQGLFRHIGFTVAELHPRRFPEQRERIEALRDRLRAQYSPDHVNLDWR
jgi:FkbM family methyltransferase